MRRAQRSSGGFTLLEALAATAILGLLAITLVPLLRQLDGLGFSERLQAQAYLKTLPPVQGLSPGTVRTVPGHPSWSLLSSELVAGPEPAPPPGSAPPVAPSHHWSLLRIRANGSGEILAESLVMTLGRGGQP